MQNYCEGLLFKEWPRHQIISSLFLHVVLKYNQALKLKFLRGDRETTKKTPANCFAAVVNQEGDPLHRPQPNLK